MEHVRGCRGSMRRRARSNLNGREDRNVASKLRGKDKLCGTGSVRANMENIPCQDSLIHLIVPHSPRKLSAFPYLNDYIISPKKFPLNHQNTSSHTFSILFLFSHIFCSILTFFKATIRVPLLPGEITYSFSCPQ